MFINGILAQASNVKPESSSSYTVDDFQALYPQFKGLIPDAAISQYVVMANACVNQHRYGAMWHTAIGLFTAHFCALHLQAKKDAGSDASSVLAAATNAGLLSGESADGVSYSREIGSITNDLSGWAGFKLTAYGVQFATLAKMAGKGGMYVW